MPAPPLSYDLAKEAWDAWQRHGGARVLGAKKAAAAECGLSYQTFSSRVNRYKEYENIDPAVKNGMEAVGANMVPALVWAKTKSKDGVSYSTLLKPKPADVIDMRALVTEGIQECVNDAPLKLPPKFIQKTGNLFVLDPADVHIGKLCTSSETGFTYSEDIAEHRMVEGSKGLLEKAMSQDVTRVLFVIGNDICHIDTPKGTTTSGTPQDTHGTIQSNFRVAQKANTRVVKMALEMGLGVDIIHVPSNHDWFMGWAVAQVIGALFEGHPNVTATDYGISEIHRKYYRFGNNLFGLTHGDGAKEQDLPDLMLVEAREHIAECHHRFWLLHHYHHKMRTAVGLRTQPREKDHLAMTAIHSGVGAVEGDNINIEYVRSPSPPDGWHHRNGYINRQAVEGFVHHPFDGQVARFTEWF